MAEFSGNQCRTLSGFKSRSQSPKKRQRESGTVMDEDEAAEEENYEEELRGRKRRRSCESSWTNFYDESQSTIVKITDSYEAKKIVWPSNNKMNV